MLNEFDHNSSPLMLPQTKMGTRGLFGFVYKGRMYVFYNAYDSNPSNLGKDLLVQLKQMTFEKCQELLLQLRVDKIRSYAYEIQFDLKTTLEKKLVDPKLNFVDIHFGIEWVYKVDFDRNVYTVATRENAYNYGLDFAIANVDTVVSMIVKDFTN